VKAELAEALIELADDELVLGHRDSEWTGHAPILEEDIAFANLALDEIGHAAVWYRLAAELLDEDPEVYPDRMIFRREPGSFRCARLVELPKGDWAFTIVRQYLFDSAESLRLSALVRSRHAPLAHAAGKIAVEERYHLRHTAAWVTRLGRGTEESRARMQAALVSLWPLAGQLFAPPPAAEALTRAEVFPQVAELGQEWEAGVRASLAGAGLVVPADRLATGSDRRAHTDHLAPLVEEMQSVARLEPEGNW
jgi:ring-1,2-phenylacetyl-CoA epoxidase subunit PaaC